MKKSEFIEKLKRTIRLSALRTENVDNSEKRLDLLVDDIMETLSLNKVKPSKWIQRRIVQLPNGATRTDDLRFRFGWETENNPQAPEIDTRARNRLQLDEEPLDFFEDENENQNS